MGTISPKAVKEFLERPRDSHVWMKRLKNRELDEALADVGFEPCSSKVKPLQKHQKVCVLLGIGYKVFAFWLDMGTGKTRIALELLAFWIREGRITGALVLGKSEDALIGWEREIKEWRINLPILTLLNSASTAKWEALAEFEGGLVLATYPGFARMVTKMKPHKNPRKKKMKLYIVPSKVKALAKHLQAYVCDESTELGNKKSLQYRICNQLAKYMPIRYELAGRPFGRDPTMMWSQLYLLDRGETLGDSLGMFRAAFFKTKENFFGGMEHTFRRDMRPKLNRILRHRSIQYRFDECGTLPKMVPTLEEVHLPGEAQAYYEQFVKQIKRTHANFQERQNSFIRMRQVSSGFVGFLDDETGEKAEIAFAENPKLDRLIDLIQEVPRGRKWVIFHEFTYSGRMITKALTKLGIKHGWLWGGTKNGRELQEQFNEDPDFDGLIVNHKKGGFSLNLQIANYLFFYESPVPVIYREQAERRVRRKGQKWTVFQYDLVTRGTADAGILAHHRQGGDLFRAVIHDPAVLDEPWEPLRRAA